VLARLSPFERGALQVEVEGRRGLTPFARWAEAFGLAPLLLVALVLLGACGRWRRAAS
jgi:apolipoprotein N-acyltransferase